MNDIIKSEGLAHKGLNLETFQKSHIADALGYSDIKFDIKGSAIKKALEKHKSDYVEEKADAKVKMAITLDKCDDIPSENPSEYMFRGVKDRVTYIPKLFSWRTIDKEYAEARKEGGEEEKEANYYSKYNGYAINYIEACVEIIHIDNYLANLDDKKTYQLRPNQVATLGIEKADIDELEKGEE